MATTEDVDGKLAGGNYEVLRSGCELLARRWASGPMR
jgi:hypothetical protein